MIWNTSDHEHINYVFHVLVWLENTRVSKKMSAANVRMIAGIVVSALTCSDLHRARQRADVNPSSILEFTTDEVDEGRVYIYI